MLYSHPVVFPKRLSCKNGDGHKPVFDEVVILETTLDFVLRLCELPDVDA